MFCWMPDRVRLVGMTKRRRLAPMRFLDVEKSTFLRLSPAGSPLFFLGGSASISRNAGKLWPTPI